MKPKIFGALGVCLAAAWALAGTGNEQMKRGAEAFNRSDYSEAVAAFRAAAQADPQALLPRLHLANAMLHQLTLIAAMPDRKAAAPPVKAALEEVLARDPLNTTARWDLAMYHLTLNDFDAADHVLGELTSQVPGDQQAWYQRGMAKWAKVYPHVAQAKAAAGIPPHGDAPLPNAAERERLKAAYGRELSEAHRYLNEALALDPKYSDALAYDNLLYRMDAELASSKAEADALIARADDRVREALAARRAHASRQTIPEVSATSAPPRLVPLPPPPPPPPPAPPAPPSPLG